MAKKKRKTTRKTKPIKERFFRHVCKSKNGCWLWTAGKTINGYGCIRIGSAKDGQGLAHRISWAIHNGKIPKGICVLHRCDNPPCVNPKHLFLGTKKDNTEDMIKKGRARFGGPKGERHGMSKLTSKDVRKMRKERSSGASYLYLAGKYNVDRATVNRVCILKAWQHVR